MRTRTRILAAAAMAACALAWAGTARAQSVSAVAYSDMMQRLNALEARQADLENIALSGDCGASSCDPCIQGGWYFLYENVIVKPHFTRDAAFYVVDDIANTNDSYREVPFDWDYSYSPRFELGYISTDCCLGGRIRYWHLDESTTLSQDVAENVHAGFAGPDGTDVNIDETSGVITASHSINLDVLDLEATAVRGNFTYSGGVRYMAMNQQYVAFHTDDPSGIRARHDFEGFGPVVGIEGFFPSRWCNISFFTRVRGSMLYGDSSLHAQTNETPPNVVDRSVNSDLIGIGELQIGLDWRRELAYSTFFVTAALEGQYWLSAGTGQPGLINDGDVANYQDESAQNADMGFVGATIGLGLIY